MDSFPKILPGYYWNRGIDPWDYKCCRIYKGPNGQNPISNGYGSVSIHKDNSKNDTNQIERCGIAPKFMND